MSNYELQRMMESLGGLIGTFGSYIIAAAMSSVILTLGIRWFIFRKAGEKGWKAIIPVYSDYIYYRIAWDGRIFVMLIAASIAGGLVSGILGLINATLGTVVGVILNTAVAGAQAIAGMIVQFKMARAFGRNDYFAVGLYFLGQVFSAILAFGDAEYKGRKEDDGIGVPQFVDDLGNRASAAASAAAAAAAQQLQQRQQAAQRQPQQMAPTAPQQAAPVAPQQPQYPQQGYQQQYYQAPANAQAPQQYQAYPAAPQQPVQRSRRASRSVEE